MHGLVAENEIQFADVLEHPVQRLHEYLDQIDERERGFRRGRDHDEREGRVRAISDLRGRVGGATRSVGACALREERWQGQEVAC